jgi:hypothetical protein
MMGLAYIAFILSFAAPQGEWELVENEEGITVSRREVPGSDLLAFRGEGDLDAPLEVAAQVIFDTTRATEWATDLKESRLLKWTSAEAYLEYDRVGTPFILKDRDFLSEVTLTVRADTVTFRYRPATDSAVPPAKCCVRGALLDTTFVLTRKGPHTTHVDAYVQIDPKGAIPTFIVNWVTEDWPTDTFKALRKQVKKADIAVDPRFAAAASAP